MSIMYICVNPPCGLNNGILSVFGRYSIFVTLIYLFFKSFYTRLLYNIYDINYFDNNNTYYNDTTSK